MAAVVASGGDVQNVRKRGTTKTDAENVFEPCGVKATQQFPWGLCQCADLWGHCQ